MSFKPEQPSINQQGEAVDHFIKQQELEQEEKQEQKSEFSGTSEKIMSPESESKENRAEREKKTFKALLAISAGVLWFDWKYIAGTTEKDDKDIEEKGWLRTMAEKAANAYKKIDEADKIISKGGGFGDIFEDLLVKNKEKEAKEAS